MNTYSPNPSASLKPDPKRLLFKVRLIWAALLIGFLVSSAFFYLAPADQSLASRKILILVNIFLLDIVPAATFVTRALMFRRQVDGVIPYASWIRGNATFWAGCMAVAVFGVKVASIH